jgi:hypothetical protein
MAHFRARDGAFSVPVLAHFAMWRKMRHGRRIFILSEWDFFVRVLRLELDQLFEVAVGDAAAASHFALAIPSRQDFILRGRSGEPAFEIPGVLASVPRAHAETIPSGVAAPAPSRNDFEAVFLNKAFDAAGKVPSIGIAIGAEVASELREPQLARPRYR